MKNFILNLAVITLLPFSMASASDFNERVSDYTDNQKSIECLNAQIERLQISNLLLGVTPTGKASDNFIDMRLINSFCDGRPEEFCMKLRRTERALKSNLEDAVKIEEQACK